MEGRPRTVPARMLYGLIFALCCLGAVGVLTFESSGSMGLAEAFVALLSAAMAGILVYSHFKVVMKVPVLDAKGLHYVALDPESSRETVLKWSEVKRYARVSESTNESLGSHLILWPHDNQHDPLRVRLQHCTDGFKNFGYLNSWWFNRALLANLGWNAEKSLDVDPSVFEELCINPVTWEPMRWPRRWNRFSVLVAVIVVGAGLYLKMDDWLAIGIWAPIAAGVGMTLFLGVIAALLSPLWRLKGDKIELVRPSQIS